ncbi:MAG: response regulator transcription factor [Anaerolineae bacterium]|nr:response regulator transcription factor [Anaerolineae bacterium]
MGYRILLGDEADVVLIGVQTILDWSDNWDTIYTARSGGELIEIAREAQPDVIVFNERLDPLIDVLALVERLKNAAPQSRLVVLGGQVDGLLVRDLFACGVLGYLFLGDDLGDCLPPALGTALNNRPYLSPTANAEYLVAMQSPLRNWQLDSEARAVLRLLARGLHISQIAEQMDVPLRRIYWVRQKLRKRFGANTNEHLISMAVSEGFAYGDR